MIREVGRLMTSPLKCCPTRKLVSKMCSGNNEINLQFSPFAAVAAAVVVEERLASPAACSVGAKAAAYFRRFDVIAIFKCNFLCSKPLRLFTFSSRSQRFRHLATFYENLLTSVVKCRQEKFR